MKVELLVVPDCPNERPTAAMLRAALDDAGLTGVSVDITVVDTVEQAERLHFTGSPTVLVNGSDPFARPDAAPALACRLYAHPTGPTGVPDRSALRDALAAAADPFPT